MNPLKAREVYEGLKDSSTQKSTTRLNSPHIAIVDLKYLTQSESWNKFLAMIAGKIEEQEKYLSDARNSSEIPEFDPILMAQHKTQILLIKERIDVYKEVMGLPLLVLEGE